MNLVFAVADPENDDAPVLVHGAKIESNTQFAAKVANYGQTPGGVWVPFPLATDGLAFTTSPQPRYFGQVYTVVLANLATGIVETSLDAANYLRAQFACVTDKAGVLTLYQDTDAAFPDLTKTLYTQHDLELQADGKYRFAIVVDLTWRYVKATVYNTSGSTQGFVKAQVSLSGVR